MKLSETYHEEDGWQIQNEGDSSDGLIYISTTIYTFYILYHVISSAHNIYNKFSKLLQLLHILLQLHTITQVPSNEWR